MSSSALVNTMSSNTSPLVGLSDTWCGKLSLTHSRTLLDCSQPAGWLFQQIARWLNSLIRIRACKCGASYSWSKEASSTGSLIRQPALGPGHKVSLTELVLKFHPQALNLSMAVSERLLLTIDPFFNTEGNTSSTLGRAMSPPQRGVGGEVVKAMISSVTAFSAMKWYQLGITVLIEGWESTPNN